MLSNSMRRIASAGGMYLGFEMLAKLVPFLVVALLTHYLSPSEFALISIFSSLLGIVGVLVGMGMHGYLSVIYFKAGQLFLGAAISRLIVLQLAALFVVVVVMCMLQDFLVVLTGLSFVWLLVLPLAALSQNIVNYQLNLWQYARRPLFYGAFQLISALVAAGLTISFVVLGDLGWQGRCAGVVLSSVLGAFVVMWLLKKTKRFVCKFNMPSTRRILRFSLPLVPHKISSWVLSGMAVVLIAHFAGKQVAGVCALAIQLAIVFNVALVALLRAGQPELYRILSERSDLVRSKLPLLALGGAGIAACAALGYWVVCYFLVHFFIDERYVGALNYLPYFLGFYALTFCSSVLVSIMVFDGRTLNVAYATLFSASLYLILVFVSGEALQEYAVLGSLTVSSLVNLLVVFRSVGDEK